MYVCMCMYACVCISTYYDMLNTACLPAVASANLTSCAAAAKEKQHAGVDEGENHHDGGTQLAISNESDIYYETVNPNCDHEGVLMQVNPAYQATGTSYRGH